MSDQENHSSNDWISILGIICFCFMMFLFFVNVLSIKQAEIDQKNITNRISRQFSPNDYFFKKYIEAEDLRPFIFDTIRLPSINFNDLIEDDRNEIEFSSKELREYLKEKSYKFDQRLCIWNEKDVFDAIYQYNRLEPIPYQLVKRLVPKGHRRNQLVKYELKDENNEKRVQVFRKIEKIYGINELEDHLQLIVLGYGQFFPNIQLITLEKETLNYVDRVEVYSCVQNKFKNITRIKGCLNKEFTTLNVKEIHSETAWSDNSDTIEYSYEIHQTGKIELIK